MESKEKKLNYNNDSNIHKSKKNLKENDKDNNNKDNDSLSNRLDNMNYKLFSTELDYFKNTFWNKRNNYCHNIKILSNKNNTSVSEKNKKNVKMFTNLMNFCHEIYGRKNQDNSSRMQLREELLYKFKSYINNLSKKKSMNPKFNFDNRKSGNKCENSESSYKKKRTIQSFDSNKMNLRKIIKNCSKEENLPEINFKKARIITYGNYAKNSIKFNHPQIYTLSNNFYKKRLTPIKTKTQNNNKPFLEFSNLIPERKEDQKEINKQLYSVYKTMKNKNKNLVTFHF